MLLQNAIFHSLSEFHLCLSVCHLAIYSGYALPFAMIMSPSCSFVIFFFLCMTIKYLWHYTACGLAYQIMSFRFLYSFNVAIIITYGGMRMSIWMIDKMLRDKKGIIKELDISF